METDGSGTVAGFTASVPAVNPARCSGCGRCVAACPGKLITLDTAGYRKTARIISKDRCTCCSRCIQNCPIAAFDTEDAEVL